MIFTALVVVFPILLALGYAIALTRSKAEDAKLRMLDSLVRSATDDLADSQYRHAAWVAASLVHS